MPAPDDQTLDTADSIRAEISSLLTQTPVDWDRMYQLARQLSSETSTHSPMLTRQASEPDYSEGAYLSPPLPPPMPQRVTLTAADVDQRMRELYQHNLSSVRTGTRVDRAIVSRMTQQTSPKVRNTFKQFSQRIENTE